MSDINWRDLSAGMRIKSNGSGFFEVVKIHYTPHITIRFIDTGYIAKFDRVHAANGSVSDPYRKSNNGVGYLGRNKSKEMRKQAMGSWGQIMKAYSEGRCGVSHEWLNFSNYLSWWQETIPSGMCAVKNNGASIYCKQTCRAVTIAERNVEISKHRMRTHVFYDTINDVEIESISVRGLARKLGVYAANIQALISGRVTVSHGLIYKGLSK